MEQGRSNPPSSSADVYTGSHRWGLVVFARVAVILGLWVVGFIAFLLAPLLVLLVAWVVGLAILALRHRGRSESTPVGPPAGTHRFGTRRGSVASNGSDAS